jgi:hypothetical protein
MDEDSQVGSAQSPGAADSQMSGLTREPGYLPPFMEFLIPTMKFSQRVWPAAASFHRT